MSLNLEPTNLSPVKRALQALADMQAKLDALEDAKREPIAIIGMGCRFPGGADSLDAFWKLLRDGVDAIVEVPSDRWDVEAYYNPNPDTPGKTCVREGGFLDRVDAFNPQFFGISAREAISMDPQQRLLLEVGWEALENASQSPERLHNSSTGVFVGIYFHDYNQVIQEKGARTQIDAFCATGNSLSVAAGRLSYTLGLKGPSLAIDTACSSSLVAVHLACQSLRQKECNVALAGGVSLILTPDITIALSQARMLNPDGRCKTFDAAANGFVRGEGCGVIVLKRLSDALADEDNILALIRGSAVNHNGRSSSLIAPNGISQQAVIRQALDNAGVAPDKVDYVEVQGTGTALGEPIEVEALGAVFGKNRPQDQPLVIGSVKTNIGHLEAASGIASLIKAVLSLQNQAIPAHLHFKQPNPYINWDKLPVRVPIEPIPWLAREKQRRFAGVSAFGFSGTNAHIVVEEAPVSELGRTAIERPLHLLTISAKTETSLVQLVERYEKHLAANPDLNLRDICFTANTGRSHFQHRLSVVAPSLSELGDKLAAFVAGHEAVGLCQGKATNASTHVAFLFSGEESISPGMGHQLYETQPTFHHILNQCQEILHPDLEQPLLEILFAQSAASSHANTITRNPPALFALEYALFELWKSWGIEPMAIAGFGIGEYAAACAAGVFSLADGLKLVAARGHLKQPEAFEQVAKSIAYSQPQISLVSDLTGKLITTEIATPGYWCRGDRQPTFFPSLETLRQHGCEIFLELGPKPILWEMGGQCLPEVEEEAWLPSLNPVKDDWQQILESLGSLYVRGAKVNWLGFDRGYSRRRLQLPTYPWERQRYWFEPSENRQQKVERNVSPVDIPDPIAYLFKQGEAEKLAHQLQASGKLSEDELKLLPKLLELLENQFAAESSKETELAPLPKVATALTTEDIQAWLVDKIAKELGVKSDDIDTQAPFDSYGLDSMLAIGIASAGQQFLGFEVSPLLLMYYPTIDSLSQHLAEEFAASGSEIFEI